MIGHYYKNANLHELICQRRPKVIMEVGCHIGEFTRVLASLKDTMSCKVIGLSDRKLEIPGVEFITGISYKEIPKLPDASLGLVIIDTDHNYWTLQQELLALMPKMEEGGLIAMHDVEEFYYDTGYANAYWNGDPYPKDQIMEAHKHGGPGLCVIDFLYTFRGDFKLVKWVPEHFGCAIIEKRTTTQTRLIGPGTGSLVAPPPQ